HEQPKNIALVYRRCIERGLLRREQVAPNTFRRVVNRFELLTPETASENKKRLAFAKAHANELWQADTMVGPYVKDGDGHTQAKLIAFIDDASRVCCHGEFFLAENTDTLIKAFRSALYKRGIPETPASRRLAICARARSRSVSTAPVLAASSSSSRGSAW